MENSTKVKGIEVYKAIASVAAAIAKEGIKKTQRNQQQNYAFRGIDDLYNALAPKLAEAGLVILPRIMNREIREVTSDKGKAIFYVTLTVEYDFISAIDGSKHTARFVGEAMDTGDKATNKAASSAFKYLCFQTFCIPTESEEADALSYNIMSSYNQSLKDAISMIMKCNTHEELTLLKSTLPLEIVTNPQFKETGLKVYEAIKQTMEAKQMNQPAQMTQPA